MYALIIVIAVLSPAGGAVTPVGVTSQVVGKFKNLDQCKAASCTATDLSARQFETKSIITI